MLCRINALVIVTFYHFEWKLWRRTAVEFLDKWALSYFVIIIIFICIDNRLDILQHYNAVTEQINNVFNHFGKLDSLVKMRLLTTYCCSSYGNVLWELSYSYVESICGAGIRGVRRFCGLPYNAHGFLLPLLSGSLPLNDEELMKRFVTFAQ